MSAITDKYRQRIEQDMTAMTIYAAVQRGCGIYASSEGRPLPVLAWTELPDSHRVLLRKRAAVFAHLAHLPLEERLYASWYCDRRVRRYEQSSAWVWELWITIAREYRALTEGQAAA